jgi:tyrosyl-tRNA synthetase
VGANLPTIRFGGDETGVTEALVALGFCSSKGEAKRKIAEGAVKLDGEVIRDHDFAIGLSDNPVKISLGKKRHGLLTR